MHVLVPVDESDPARAALEHAITEFPDATVTVLHVIDPYESTVTALFDPGERIERLEENAADLLAELEELAATHAASIETETVVGDPARRITSSVESEGVDHVVIGSHGRRGTSRVLLGSVAEAVARRAPVPVTVVR